MVQIIPRVEVSALCSLRISPQAVYYLLLVCIVFRSETRVFRIEASLLVIFIGIVAVFDFFRYTAYAED